MFRDALARDKTRTQVFDISELGLVEMTRKRIGEGLLESFRRRADGAWAGPCSEVSALRAESARRGAFPNRVVVTSGLPAVASPSRAPVGPARAPRRWRRPSEPPPCRSAERLRDRQRDGTTAPSLRARADVWTPNLTDTRGMNAARTAVTVLSLGVIYLSLLRRPILTWGADHRGGRSEVSPEDELLEHADIVATRAITIDAPPTASGRGSSRWALHPAAARTPTTGSRTCSASTCTAPTGPAEFQHPQRRRPFAPARTEMRLERVEPERVLSSRSEDGAWVGRSSSRSSRRDAAAQPQPHPRRRLARRASGDAGDGARVARDGAQDAARDQASGRGSGDGGCRVAGRGWSRRSIAPATLGVSRPT